MRQRSCSSSRFLVPLVVPILVMFLRLFLRGIEASHFTTLAAAYIGESVEGQSLTSFQNSLFCHTQGNVCAATRH